MELASYYAFSLNCHPIAILRSIGPLPKLAMRLVWTGSPGF